MNLYSIRFQCTQYQLNDWSLIKVTGDDREKFFQGQVTNDLNILKMNEGHCTARLNRTGKLQSFFFIGKLPSHLLILCPNELTQTIKDDFEKYIIMDDVVLDVLPIKPSLVFNSFLRAIDVGENFFDFNFYGLNARLVLHQIEGVVFTNKEELEQVRVLNGWPKWRLDISDKYFINDTFLNQVAISYKKGCFLGQETVAKIENNRGAAYYPMLFKMKVEENLSGLIGSEFEVDERKAGTLFYQVGSYLQVSLFRDFRIIDRALTIKFGSKILEVVVKELPFYRPYSRLEIAQELYHIGVELFQQNDTEGAMLALKRAIAFDPTLADSYESLGVMLGREEKYNEAIEWMDRLLTVDPKSVMAHTNKSLYLMKLGKIEEAEAEKSLATVKSFAVFGAEAKFKKQIEEEKKKKEEEMLRRERMFLQVLEIDPEDTIALYGLADILFYRKEFQSATINLEKVISIDPKYSTAYLLLGKAYEALSETEKARSTYQAGINIASKQGDMMPANEMQSRLNQLVVGTSLN